jgi:hypothetical protein
MVGQNNSGERLQQAKNLEREGVPSSTISRASSETLKITARARAEAKRPRADETSSSLEGASVKARRRTSSTEGTRTNELTLERVANRDADQYPEAGPATARGDSAGEDQHERIAGIALES